MKNLFTAISILIFGKRRWLLAGVLLVFAFFAFQVDAQVLGFDIVQSGIGLINKLLLLLVVFLVNLLLTVIDLLIGVAQYNSFLTSPAVTEGWIIVRDVANMFFSVAFIVMVYGTIFNSGSLNYRQVLPKLLLMAVLINFSKAIAGFLIDLSQVPMLHFIYSFKDSAAASLTRGLGIDKVLALDTAGALDKVISPSTVLPALLLSIIISSIALFIVTIFLVMLVMRIVMLWFLIVMAPLAFLGKAIPSAEGKTWSKWWEEMNKWLVNGPVMAFFLWLSMVMMSSPGNIIEFGETNNQLADGITSGEATATTKLFVSAVASNETLMRAIFSVGMLLASLTIANQVSGGVSSKLMSGLKKAGGMALKGAAVAGVGALAVSKFAGKKLGTGVMKGASNFMKRADYDKGWKGNVARVAKYTGNKAKAGISATKNKYQDFTSKGIGKGIGKTLGFALSATMGAGMLAAKATTAKGRADIGQTVKTMNDQAGVDYQRQKELTIHGYTEIEEIPDDQRASMGKSREDRIRKEITERGGRYIDATKNPKVAEDLIDRGMDENTDNPLGGVERRALRRMFADPKADRVNNIFSNPAMARLLLEADPTLPTDANGNIVMKDEGQVKAAMAKVMNTLAEREVITQSNANDWISEIDDFLKDKLGKTLTGIKVAKSPQNLAQNAESFEVMQEFAQRNGEDLGKLTDLELTTIQDGGNSKTQKQMKSVKDADGQFSRYQEKFVEERVEKATRLALQKSGMRNGDIIALMNEKDKAKRDAVLATHFEKMGTPSDIQKQITGSVDNSAGEFQRTSSAEVLSEDDYNRLFKALKDKKAFTAEDRTMREYAVDVDIPGATIDEKYEEAKMLYEQNSQEYKALKAQEDKLGPREHERMRLAEKNAKGYELLMKSYEKRVADYKAQNDQTYEQHMDNNIYPKIEEGTRTKFEYQTSTPGSAPANFDALATSIQQAYSGEAKVIQDLVAHILEKVKNGKNLSADEMEYLTSKKLKPQDVATVKDIYKDENTEAKSVVDFPTLRDMPAGNISYGVDPKSPTFNSKAFKDLGFKNGQTLDKKDAINLKMFEEANLDELEKLLEQVKTFSDRVPGATPGSLQDKYSAAEKAEIQSKLAGIHGIDFDGSATSAFPAQNKLRSKIQSNRKRINLVDSAINNTAGGKTALRYAANLDTSSSQAQKANDFVLNVRDVANVANTPEIQDYVQELMVDQNAFDSFIKDINKVFDNAFDGLSRQDQATVLATVQLGEQVPGINDSLRRELSSLIQKSLLSTGSGGVISYDLELRKIGQLNNQVNEAEQNRKSSQDQAQTKVDDADKNKTNVENKISDNNKLLNNLNEALKKNQEEKVLAQQILQSANDVLSKAELDAQNATTGSPADQDKANKNLLNARKNKINAESKISSIDKKEGDINKQINQTQTSLNQFQTDLTNAENKVNEAKIEFQNVINTQNKSLREAQANFNEAMTNILSRSERIYQPLVNNQQAAQAEIKNINTALPQPTAQQSQKLYDFSITSQNIENLNKNIKLYTDNARKAQVDVEKLKIDADKNPKDPAIIAAYEKARDLALQEAKILSDAIQKNKTDQRNLDREIKNFKVSNKV